MGNDKELDAHHRATVEKIFSHPMSHNIQWHDVLSLLQNVASVTKEHEGRYTVTLGAETETFDVPAPPRHQRGTGRRPATDAPGGRDCPGVRIAGREDEVLRTSTGLRRRARRFPGRRGWPS